MTAPLRASPELMKLMMEKNLMALGRLGEWERDDEDRRRLRELLIAENDRIGRAMERHAEELWG